MGTFVLSPTAHPQRMNVRFAISVPLSNLVLAHAAAQQTTESETIARKRLFRLLIIKSELSVCM